MVSFDEQAQRAVIDVRCSKGTYVRQIAADLGAATEAGGYCSELRRTEVGEFTVDRAASPERILEDGDGPWMIQPREALPHLPERVLDGRELEDVLHGRMLPAAGETGPVRLVHERRLVAIGRPDERGLRPAVVLGA